MSFIFGGDTEMSYEDLQRKRSRADTIAASLTRTPKNVGEGLHAIGQALAARGIDRRVQKRQGELDEQWQEQVAGMGLGPDRAAIFASLPYEQRASASLNWLNQQDVERRAAASRGAAASQQAQKQDQELAARQAIAQALSGQTTRAPMPGPTTSAAAPSALPSVADGGVMGANSVPVSQPSPVMQTTTTPPTQSSIVQALIGNQNVPINQIDDIVGLLPEAPDPMEELRRQKLQLEVAGMSGEAPPAAFQVQSSDILPNGTTVMVGKSGDLRVVLADGTTLEGAEAIKAVDEGQREKAQYERDIYANRRLGTNVAEADTGAAAAAAGAAGSQAIDLSGEAWASVGRIGSSNSNITTSIEALDNGARAGAVDRFLPNITEASATLRNSMDRLGLDVIAGTTFGALSEAELRLAMETAVPRNLDEPALRSWLVKKQEANEKAMAMMSDAAVFLGTPGNTLADWIRKNERAGKPPSDAAPQATHRFNPATGKVEAIK